jgi:Mg2+ and Co2+ transporter CorA
MAHRWGRGETFGNGVSLSGLLAGALSRLLPTAPAAPLPADADRRQGLAAVVDCALYVGGRRQPGNGHYAEEFARSRRRRNGFVWLGLHEPSAALMAEVGRTFGLHELTVGQALTQGLAHYFADVTGRLARAVDRVNAFDDLLNSVLQARLAQVAVDQNNDMRKIASWAAIAAAQTAIAGIYGMNFDHMPELHWQYGYLGAIGLMAVGGGILHRLFRRSGWL